MRVLRFAPLLALPIVVGIGCMPVQFLSTRDDGSGGEGGATGFGGDNGVTITGTSTSGGTGGGAATSSGFAGPHSYAYMCGGSQAACEPGADASECAPGGTGNMGGASPDAGVKLTCQLIADGDHAAAKCGLAGGAGDGDPCNDVSDCQAGLGCAATSVTNVCRQYCCGDPELCPAQTFCQPTTMAKSSVEVPLCVPAKMCELLNDSAYCTDGQTCTIVRAVGTTSCVDPGDGHEGDACPCAAGFMCSNATGTCVKLCHLEGDECGNGTCQGGTLPYPAGIGFCVPL
jgi:hypothetical protein